MRAGRTTVIGTQRPGVLLAYVWKPLVLRIARKRVAETTRVGTLNRGEAGGVRLLMPMAIRSHLATEYQKMGPVQVAMYNFQAVYFQGFFIHLPLKNIFLF